MKSLLRLGLLTRALCLPYSPRLVTQRLTDGCSGLKCSPWQLLNRHYSLPNQSQGPGTVEEATVVKRLQQMEHSLKFHGYSVLRIGAGIVVMSGIGLYVFREHVRENVADEVSTVASRSLGDENVKQKAEELSKALLHAVLSDEQIQQQAVVFLQDILSKPGTQEAVIRLLTNVLSDPEAQRKLLITLKQLIARSFSDPTFRRNLAHNLNYLFNDENTKQGLSILFSYILDDAAFRDHAKTFSQEVLASKSVTDQAVLLGKSVIHGVVSDDTVQKNTGDGLWNAFTYSVKPRWSWFGYGRTHGEEAREQDTSPLNDDKGGESETHRSSQE